MVEEMSVARQNFGHVISRSYVVGWFWAGDFCFLLFCVREDEETGRGGMRDGGE